MTILFAHGLESGPIGRKSQALMDAGYEVLAPDCRGLDLATRVERLVEALVTAKAFGAVGDELEGPPKQAPLLLVGSSFGGIAGLVAALVAEERGVVLQGLLLCAPALMLPLPPGTVERLALPSARTILVHGTRDEVIPIEVSRRFAAEHGAELREVDDDHGLGHAGLPVILAAVKELHPPR
jgi:predicted alpha/beta-hydrolase family hydrolase